MRQEARPGGLDKYKEAALYTIEQRFVLIAAVMHSSRKPGYWKQRQRGR